MAIKAYVGRMGSGKTYEVVTEIILGGLRRGRRVVSNVAGLDFEAMKGILLREGLAEVSLGELVQIEHAQVLDPEFWRTDKDGEQGVDSFIRPGDLLALDEIWRFWSGFSVKGDDGQKRPDRVMNFFRMHRHFTHADTGVACDVALITQDVMDISRQVRAVIEETYRMQKLTAIGSTKRYRIDVFQGARTTRRPLRQLQRSYNPAYFGLYRSHSQRKAGDAEACEENIDGRGNILRGAIFRIVLPVGALVFVASCVLLWRFFHPESSKPETARAIEGGQTVTQESLNQSRAVGESSQWRVVGYFEGAGGLSFLLRDDSRNVRVISPPRFKITALSAETFLPSGEAVTTWSGPGARGGIIEQAAGAK